LRSEKGSGELGCRLSHWGKSEESKSWKTKKVRASTEPMYNRKGEDWTAEAACLRSDKAEKETPIKGKRDTIAKDWWQERGTRQRNDAYPVPIVERNARRGKGKPPDGLERLKKKTR